MQMTNSQIKSAQIDAVIIRADGTADPLGTIAYYHRNPIKQFMYWLKKKLKRG